MVTETTQAGEILIINEKLGYLINTTQVTINTIKEYIKWCEDGRQTHLITFDGAFGLWVFVGMTNDHKSYFNSVLNNIKSNQAFGSIEVEELAYDNDHLADDEQEFYKNIDIFDSVEFNNSIEINNNVIRFVSNDPNDDDNWNEIEISFEDFKKLF